MTTSFDSVATLSEQDLLDHFAGLVDRDRQTSSALLVAIAEIDERRIWAKHGCPSMFNFCMERFHMSEQVTAKRIWAARTARRFPVILPMVERGELHLGAIHLLAGHLTAENHAQVLERAKHKSSREVEQLIAELSPKADVPSRIRAMPVRKAGAHAGGAAAAAGSSDAASADRDQAVGVANQQHSAEVVSTASDQRSPRTSSQTGTKPIVPLSPRRYKIEITVDEATHDKLRSLQDLLNRSETGRDPAAIISRAIDVLLERTLARRAGCTDRPKPAKAHRTGSTATDAAASQCEPRTRTIPAAVRREVWRRDCGRCCYVDALGRRCAATSNVEFHHRTPFAVGGEHTSENIELRCAAHNQYQADLDFGRSFMDARRGKGAPTPMDGRRGKPGPTSNEVGRGQTQPTFPGECWRTAVVP